MNGNDLLMYSQMKQHQAELVREAAGLHAARAITQAQGPHRRVAVGTVVQHAAVDPKGSGAVRPGTGHTARPASGGGATRAARGAGGRAGSTSFRRLAARFGTSLVGVGRRLERMAR